MGWLQKIVKNVKNKGWKSLSLGELSGNNGSKRQQAEQLSAFNAAGLNAVPAIGANPAGVDPTELKPGDMPQIDSVAVEEARKKAALLAAARGGRASTLLTDKTY